MSLIRKKKQLNVELDLDLANQFAGTCKIRGTSMVAVLERFIAQWVAGEQGGSPPTPAMEEKNVFDELMEIDPDAAEGLVPFIRTQIEKARNPRIARTNRLVPEQKTVARASSRQKNRA